MLELLRAIKNRENVIIPHQNPTKIKSWWGFIYDIICIYIAKGTLSLLLTQ